MTATRSPRRALARRGGGLALLVICWIVGIAAPAAAHPYLLSSNPAAGTVLQTAPTAITIDYTEGLDRGYCHVTIVSPSGSKISTTQLPVSEAADLSVKPETPLSEQGTYAVEWTAVGDDGHTVIGSFGFSVGHPSKNSAAGAVGDIGSGTSTSADSPQRLLRIVLPFAAIIAAGLLLLGGSVAAAGRRASRLRAGSIAATGVIVVALSGIALHDGGISTFVGSDIGRRLIAQLILVGLAALIILDGGRLSRNQEPTRNRRLAGIAVSLGLMVSLALSSHASSQPESRRWLAIVVYSVHLTAVSVWIGALLAVALRIRLQQPADGDPQRSLRPLVAGSLLVVLASGVATTDWGLRRLDDVVDTLWGKLTITLLAMFLLLVLIGGIAALVHARNRPAARRLNAGLVIAESVLAVATLIVGGVVGQVAQPLSQPWPSQQFATEVGMPISVASEGAASLVVGELTPGIVGANTLNVEVGHTDADDFLHPETDVDSVTATLSCGCGAPVQHVDLRPSGDGTDWTTDVSLPTAASWLVKTTVTHTRARKPDVVSLSERVAEPSLPDQVVIGMPAALSGRQAETCRDQILGLQSAVADLNTTAADHGDLIRVVAVDLQNGTAAAMSRLTALGARIIAMPCGSTAQINSIVDSAHADGLPVVLGSENSTPDVPDVWSTEPDWHDEGAMIAKQAIAQAATEVTAIVGNSSIDRAELAGMRQQLGTESVDGQHVALHVEAMDQPTAKVMKDISQRTELVAMLANREEALPLMQAMSAANLREGWMPPHGVLASAQLMVTDLINDAGTITRLGGIEFASDIDPFDPVAQYYAARLRVLFPGVRPSFDGLHGYNAGLAIAEALKDGGGDPSSAELTALLGSRFSDFRIGTYQLGWHSTGGTAATVGFFRSTYINPMAMPSVAPGGASSLAHEGTFLDTGGFEQVAPFRRLT